MTRFLNTIIALAAVVWFGIFSAAALPHRVHHGLLHTIKSRSDSNVEPLLVTVKPYQMGPSGAAALVGTQNVSVYLTGGALNPQNQAQNLGFMTQHTENRSTSYYMPSINTPAGVKTAVSAPNLSWNVGPAGLNFTTPGAINSGRIYIVDGHLDFVTNADGSITQPDPHNPGDIASKEIWGFVELTQTKGSGNGDDELTVNLSFVDWVSLPLGMNVTFQGENGPDVVSVPGLKPDGLKQVCKDLSALDSFWPKLCLRARDNTPLRVMSPEKYISLHPDDKDATTYYEPYISKAWEKYKTVDLHINTQTSGPNSSVRVDDGQMVTCRVGQSDDILHCDKEAGDFSRPVSRDIYGCNSGPFANPSGTESWSRARVRPRLCAAFARSTLHLDGAQPSHGIGPDQYYREPITNHYARAVHGNLVDNMGYAFSYDDVSPSSGANSAGLVSRTHPLRLDIFINT
ncbi:putative glucan endo- -beta-glucosidase [Rosellinia necatrix]|uniref:Putative glucan endo--beta-glucosidase n=1 Tax=Rosellinia necatrix TaxID=77044 RepID=A0A1W2TCJ4_ROSNE|nr:putative glucan endo- -beta-glucosidase [Rosellinia necatrix]